MKYLLVFVVLTISLLSGCGPAPGTPEAAFSEFQTTQHKESFIVGPLCAAGETVVPLVTEKVKNRNLERRIYAIWFLGTAESKLPADVLEFIVLDETERKGFRREALKSLFLVDESRGKSVALRYKEQPDDIGEIANEVLNVKDHTKYKASESACLLDD